MLSTGSNTRLTPKRCAVSGINCIRPCAFRGDTAAGLKSDSTAIIASASSGSTAYRGAILLTSSAIGIRRVVDGWIARGARVAVHCVAGPRFWSTPELAECPELVARTTAVWTGVGQEGGR